jgi:hypothetical protein
VFVSVFVFVLLWILFLFLFLLLLLHADGDMVSHLFPAADMGVTASSVAGAIILGTIVPRVEIKMAPMTTTVATTNETHHSAPSTPHHKPSNV